MDKGKECWFTPSGRVELARNEFSGFRLEDRYDDRNTRESLLRRKIINLENLVKELITRIKTMEKDNEIMKANTEVLEKNFDDLKKTFVLLKRKWKILKIK
ncbi:hypothetical protein E2C01_066711 [Portunus trituberculatus]|uniref:Uncharacterized protein n=1 Tax=Portunus trituberculatus TaxID=210409 RepID=A0A5B7HRD9_PORTR|nr:hypothetical protein [Portunus trituberculatus]